MPWRSGLFPQVSEGKKIDTFCAASCSSLWAITLCLAPLELSLPEVTGGKGLASAADASFSLPRFFLSGMRSGALAKRATPEEKQNIKTLFAAGGHTRASALGFGG